MSRKMGYGPHGSPGDAEHRPEPALRASSHEEWDQSFRNTIEAIQPVISAMNAVISP